MAPKRQNFVGIQLDSAVPALGAGMQPFRTGQEDIIANKAGSTFAHIAKDNGVVLDVNDKTITVKYKSGLEESYPLSKRFGNSKGSTVPLNYTTDFKKGQKFEIREPLVWNPDWFQRSLINKNAVSFKTGVMASIALIENSDTIEDSCLVDETLAHELRVPDATTKNIIFEGERAVTNLVKVGDEVDSDSILCTITDPIAAGLSDESGALSDLSRLNSNNPKAGKRGIVSKVECLYYMPLEDMHETTRAIIRAGDRKRVVEAKESGTVPVTGELSDGMQIESKKIVLGTVVIKVTIETVLGFGTADKVVFFNQLKATNSRVVPKNMTSESGVEIQAQFGYQSISDRIVGSAETCGVVNRNQKAASLKMAEIYRGK